MNKRYCKICGRPLKKHHKFYCSRKCFYESNRGKNHPEWNHIKRICKQCGKKFCTVLSQIKHGGGKFCSPECFYKWNRGENHSRKVDKIKKVCPICRERFEVYPSLKYIKFCSKECYYKWRKSGEYSGKKNPCWKPKVKKTCRLCGKQFEVKPARRNTAKFCSLQCLGLSNCQQALKEKGHKQSPIETKIEEELKRLSIRYEKEVLLCATAIVDFYLPQNKTIIQCDGDYWHSKPGAKERDNRQDDVLAFNGFNVFRFTESEINKSAFNCVRKAVLMMRS